MKSAEKTNIIVRVSPEYKRKLRMYLLSQDKTMQDYIIELLNKDAKRKGLELPKE